MALQPCRECGKEVSTEAAACPHCGVQHPVARPQFSMLHLVLGLFGAAFVLFVILVFAADSSTPTDGAPNEAARKMSVASGCEQAITERLRSPRSARFPRNMSDAATRQTDGSYTLQSYVDAQNGFGAEIRTNFICRGTPSDGGVLIHEARLLDP